MPHAPWGPFEFRRGPAGCLLIHGLTSTPFTLRPMGEFLAAGGISVLAPRLPGHGTSWQALARTRWTDWYAAVEEAYLRLRRRCRTVVAAGLSMGGTQVLHLAAHHPELNGVIAMAPAVLLRDWRVPFLPLIRRLLRSVKGIGGDLEDPNASSEYHYDRLPTRSVAEMVAMQRHLADELSLVRCPALLAQGARDHVLPRDSARWAFARLGSRRKRLLLLPRSAHVVTLDRDRAALFRAARAFIRGLA